MRVSSPDFNKYTGKDYHFPDSGQLEQWHTYAVDYVRVYDLTNRDYREPVDPVTREFTFKTNPAKGQAATLTQQGVQPKENHQYVLRFKTKAERIKEPQVKLTKSTGRRSKTVRLRTD